MTIASEKYALYLDAETKILASQSVRFGERQLTRADLAEVRKGLAFWERKMINEKGSGAGHSLVKFV